MRKLVIALVGGVLLAFPLAPLASAQTCVKIKDGTLVATNGAQLKLGYDQWGYNYQAHMFNGLTANYSRPGTPVESGPENLVMKWSDDWLSNQDCDNDGKLDRGGPFVNVSKGWVTNHYEGDYLLGGESYHYTYFAKIVFDNGAACQAGSPSCLWNLYTQIEEVYNDPGGQAHGIVNKSKLVNPGLGHVNQ